MKLLKKYSSILIGIYAMILSLLFCSCIEEYWPELGGKYEDVLVVDGEITNEPGPYTIKLSRSTNLERPEYRPLVRYTVTILDNLGNSEILSELGAGEYITSENGIQGIPGRSYKVQIVSPNGNTYVSSFEKMRVSVGIESVFVQYETMEDLDYEYDLEGYRFYINSLPSSLDTTFFLWKLIGTYKYNANHYIKYMYDGNMHVFTPYDSLYTCYLTYKVPEIFTYSLSNLSEPNVTGYPLHFVNTEDKKLSLKYSLLTRQYVVSKKAHEYWKHLHEQNSNLGSMYSVQPFQVIGNIKSLENPEELVLGYFMVASVSENRIFVTRPGNVEFHYATECELITEDLGTMLWLWRNQWPLYLAAVYGEHGQSAALPGSQECVDCTKSGGTLTKPDFWIDNNYEK